LDRFLPDFHHGAIDLVSLFFAKPAASQYLVAKTASKA
jgi:hypothetical protein